MTTTVERSILVAVPVSTAYHQWTQFEDFPKFMGGVEAVNQITGDQLQWVAEVAGVRRQWIARILEQVPDRKVAWAAVEGEAHAGSVTFAASGPDQTEITLRLECESDRFAGDVGDELAILGRQAEHDLRRFKHQIESLGPATRGDGRH